MAPTFYSVGIFIYNSDIFGLFTNRTIYLEEYVVGEGIELGRISGDCDNETPKFQEKALLTGKSNSLNIITLNKHH